MGFREQVIRHLLDRHEDGRPGRSHAARSYVSENADDFAHLVAHFDGSHLQACAEHGPAPEPAGEHLVDQRHRWCGGAVVGRAERPAGHQWNPQDIEIVARDVAPVRFRGLHPVVGSPQQQHLQTTLDRQVVRHGGSLDPGQLRQFRQRAPIECRNGVA